MDLTEEIKAELLRRGASEVGFADLTVLPKETRMNFGCGIVIGIAFSRKAIVDNMEGDPSAYYTECSEMSEKLAQLAGLTTSLLSEHGYKALALLPSVVVSDSDSRTVLPYKTVATLAGLGWIGKSATLVTREFGSAIRFTVVLTNAPLTCGTPVTESACDEGCMICAKICPGKAVSGKLWSRYINRDEFYDAKACGRAARARARELLDVKEELCGLCISNCPWTKKALGY